MRAGCVALVPVLALGAATWRPAVAGADTARGDEGSRAWHAGANLRTDQGPHRFRAGLGARVGFADMSVVVDPKVFIDSRENDTDALVEWLFSPGGWAALTGWRLSQISIDRGRQFQHALLLGATGGLPALLARRLRVRFGLELELTVIRHGAGVDTDVISFASQRDWYDLVSANLFLRLEYVSQL